MLLNSLFSSGFASALAGINVDANTVTSVDFRINRALAVKFYVVTIIFGMCTTAPFPRIPRPLLTCGRFPTTRAN